MGRLKRASGHSTRLHQDLACKPEAGSRDPFSWDVRVYYEDTDLGGVVYHANYLRFMERARTEWLRAAGFEQDVLRERHGVQFVVVDAELVFRRPARFNDTLKVSVEVREQGRASLLFHQDVRGAAGDVLCSGDVRVACIDANNFKPRPLPGELLTELAT